MDDFSINLYNINMLIDERFPGSIRTQEKYFTYNLVGCNDDALSINGMGLRETMKPCFNHREQGNRDFLILLFYDNINLQVEDKNFSETKGKWIILKPGTAHSYGLLDNSWCHSWIHLSGKYFRNQLEESEIPLDRLQNLNISLPFENLLHSLHQEIYLNSTPIMKIIKNHIDTFILQISRLETTKRNSKIPVNIVEIKKILDFRYKEKWSLSVLANNAGYTVPYLCSAFKKYYKLTPILYLNQKRVELAKYFLINTDLRVNEISYKVGFDDIYYFSRTFKKHVGCSPKIFRDIIPRHRSI